MKYCKWKWNLQYCVLALAVLAPQCVFSAFHKKASFFFLLFSSWQHWFSYCSISPVDRRHLARSTISGPASDSDFTSVSFPHLENFCISARSKDKPKAEVERRKGSGGNERIHDSWQLLCVRIPLSRSMTFGWLLTWAFSFSRLFL